ncbi:glycosyltransferase [Spirosoma areae]
MLQTPLASENPLAVYPDRINIVIPLFNDWEALGLLLERIRVVNDPALTNRLAFLVVDDCSVTNYETLPTGIGQSLSVLRLYRNVGHQKAIALGLAYLGSLPEQYPTIVMDADGEDRPEDIRQLLQTGDANPGCIVFAHRAKRQEGLLFRLFYGVYKSVFKLLTGKVITFGNFSLVPAKQVRKLAHVSDIWNNYPGGVIRSRLPYTAIPLERGRRLAGESKMNFVSLVLHGLSAVSVLMDTTAVRLTLFCVMMVGASLFGIGIVVMVRLLTDTVVPGWASYLVFSLLIVILQAFLISLLLVFMVLSYRTQHQFIPAREFEDFVEQVEEVY